MEEKRDGGGASIFAEQDALREMKAVTVRSGKGAKDRTVVPPSVREPLETHLKK